MIAYQADQRSDPESKHEHQRAGKLRRQELCQPVDVAPAAHVFSDKNDIEDVDQDIEAKRNQCLHGILDGDVKSRFRGKQQDKCHDRTEQMKPEVHAGKGSGCSFCRQDKSKRKGHRQGSADRAGVLKHGEPEGDRKPLVADAFDRIGDKKRGPEGRERIGVDGKQPEQRLTPFRGGQAWLGYESERYGVKRTEGHNHPGYQSRPAAPFGQFDQIIPLPAGTFRPCFFRFIVNPQGAAVIAALIKTKQQKHQIFHEDHGEEKGRPFAEGAGKLQFHESRQTEPDKEGQKVNDRLESRLDAFFGRADHDVEDLHQKANRSDPSVPGDVIQLKPRKEGDYSLLWIFSRLAE